MFGLCVLHIKVCVGVGVGVDMSMCVCTHVLQHVVAGQKMQLCQFGWLILFTN